MSNHHDPEYDEMTEWVRTTEVSLGRSQSAYEHEGAIPIQRQVHPEANPDGFIPPDEVDWNEVFAGETTTSAGESAIREAPSYEPDEAEKSSVAEDLDLGRPDDPDYEGAPLKSKFEVLEEESADRRFEFVGLVKQWPPIADVYYAIMMAGDNNSAEPIGEATIHLETSRVAGSSNRWYVDDRLKEHFFVQHDPSMNHPLSTMVKQLGHHVLWVYERGQAADFPSEPIGYIHNGNLFRRPKIWQEA